MVEHNQGMVIVCFLALCIILSAGLAGGEVKCRTKAPWLGVMIIGYPNYLFPCSLYCSLCYVGELEGEVQISQNLIHHR